MLEALKNCPKSSKSSNLVTLVGMSISISSFLTRSRLNIRDISSVIKALCSVTRFAKISPLTRNFKYFRKIFSAYLVFGTIFTDFGNFLCHWVFSLLQVVKRRKIIFPSGLTGSMSLYFSSSHHAFKKFRGQLKFVHFLKYLEASSTSSFSSSSTTSCRSVVPNINSFKNDTFDSVVASNTIGHGFESFY